jgi:hypothetical protein
VIGHWIPLDKAVGEALVEAELAGVHNCELSGAALNRGLSCAERIIDVGAD